MKRTSNKLRLKRSRLKSITVEFPLDLYKELKHTSLYKQSATDAECFRTLARDRVTAEKNDNKIAAAIASPSVEENPKNQTPLKNSSGL